MNAALNCRVRFTHRLRTVASTSFSIDSVAIYHISPATNCTVVVRIRSNFVLRGTHPTFQIMLEAAL
jgi:hypothetical protein